MGRRASLGRGSGAGASAVADSSPLIGLERIHRLDLLREVFGQVMVPSAVVQEFGPGGLQDWIIERDPTHERHPRIVASRLGAGELDAMALALEIGAGRVLVDDGPARHLAHSLGLRVTGTAGVLLIAKQLTILPVVRPTLEELLGTGFRLGPDVVEQVLTAAGESH